MKNKDKYELSGIDEDLSGRTDFNISSNKSQETVESDNYSKIKKKYEQESVRQKVRQMAEESNNVSSKNIVIPEKINENNEKKDDFTSKYKTDYKTEYKKQYKVYEEPIVATKYNNRENKTEPLKVSGMKIIGIILFWIGIIMIFGIAGIAELMGNLENEFSYESMNTTIISDNKVPIDTIFNEKNHELNKDIHSFKGIETRIIENEFGERAIFVTNLNDIDFKAFELSIVFYDENKNIVDIYNEYFRALPTSHTVIAILNRDIPEYDTYEIFYDENDVKDILEYDKATYLYSGVNFENIKQDSYLIEFDVKNNLPQTIDELSYVTLLYRNNEIVYFRYGFVYDLKERKSKEESIYIDEELEYDNIEFVVNYISTNN